ncbi:MAG: YfaZ family outer membrane protein [Gallionella sp.]
MQQNTGKVRAAWQELRELFGNILSTSALHVWLDDFKLGLFNHGLFNHYIGVLIMVLRGILTASLLAGSAVACADALDINLRDNAAQVQYKAAMGGSNLGKAEFHVGGIYSQPNNVMADIGILVKDDIGGNAPGVSAGVGIKALAARLTPIKLSASALAIGGMARYSPPAARRFGIAGELYLSPNIITFGQADRYLETTVRAEYEMIPQAQVYLAYRKMEFNLKNIGNQTFDQGFNVGVKLSF